MFSYLANIEKVISVIVLRNEDTLIWGWNKDKMNLKKKQFDSKKRSYLLRMSQLNTPRTLFLQHPSQSSAQTVNEGDLLASVWLKPVGWSLNFTIFFLWGSSGTARTHALGNYGVVEWPENLQTPIHGVTNALKGQNEASVLGWIIGSGTMLSII